MATITTGPRSVGGPLSIVTYAPVTPGTTYTVASGTLTALDVVNLTTGLFTIPASGAILAKITCTAEGPAAAANHLVLGFLNHTGGALVGESALVWNTPTATAVDNLVTVTYAYRVTGLTAGAQLQLDAAAFSNSAVMTIIAAGATGLSTLPAGGPFTMEVWPA